MKFGLFKRFDRISLFYQGDPASRRRPGKVQVGILTMTDCIVDVMMLKIAVLTVILQPRDVRRRIESCCCGSVGLGFQKPAS